MRIDIEPNRGEPSDLHPYLAHIYIGKIFKKQQSFLNCYNHVISMKAIWLSERILKGAVHMWSLNGYLPVIK